MSLASYLCSIPQCGGRCRIRTYGCFHINSFQDCRNRPLCQSSKVVVVSGTTTKTLRKSLSRIDISQKTYPKRPVLMGRGISTLSLLEESNPVILSTNQAHHLLCLGGNLREVSGLSGFLVCAFTINPFFNTSGD